MKLIFLGFRNSYRFKALGNFGKSAFYGKYLVINLAGRWRYLLSKLIYFLRIGKFISIDGDPFIKDTDRGINLWLTGTRLKITKKYKGYSNNYMNMTNPIIGNEDNIFKFYPIIKKKHVLKIDKKIIFMGNSVFYENDNSDILKLQYAKKKILEDFTLIDDKNFWNKNLDLSNIDLIFNKYKILKTFLREEILSEVNKNFGKYLAIYGDSQNNKFNYLPSVYKLDKMKKIYEGNICLDTGSIMGSMSINTRSIQIIESGGLLFQSAQQDANNVWHDLIKRTTFSNLNKLNIILDKLLTENDYTNKLFTEQQDFFENSKIKIEKNLDETFIEKF